MVLVLVVGDLHIPYRASDIPAHFKKLLVPGKIQTTLVTGNLVSTEIYEFFKSVCPNVYCAKGEYDSFDGPVADEHVVDIDGLRIGLIHGHQVVPWGDKESLSLWQRKLDCDLLVSGHTHAQKTFEYGGGYFVNPGSLTGAYSPFDDEVTPSFVLMDVTSAGATLFIYTIDDAGEMKVKKKEWKK